MTENVKQNVEEKVMSTFQNNTEDNTKTLEHIIARLDGREESSSPDRNREQYGETDQHKEMRFSKEDRSMFMMIAKHVEVNAAQYREAGKWLDTDFYEAKAYWQNQMKNCYGYVLILDKEAHWKDELEKNPDPPLCDRLEYAWRQSLSDYTMENFMPELKLRAVLLIVWLLTKPEANQKEIITKFQNWNWSKDSGESGFEDIRRGLAEKWLCKEYEAGHNLSHENGNTHMELIRHAAQSLLPVPLKNASHNETDEKASGDSANKKSGAEIPDKLLTPPISKTVACKLTDMHMYTLNKMIEEDPAFSKRLSAQKYQFNTEKIGKIGRERLANGFLDKGKG